MLSSYTWALLKKACASRLSGWSAILARQERQEKARTSQDKIISGSKRKHFKKSRFSNAAEIIHHFEDLAVSL
jgi:hypothetical protein